VLKYFDREDGSRWAHLCDYFQEGDAPELAADAVRHWIRFARALGCVALSAWCPPGSPLAPFLDRADVAPVPDLDRWLVVNPNAPAAADARDASAWHLVMGDSDVF
jgi:hypothetical protein